MKPPLILNCLLLFVFSCNDFLDELPDNRTQLDTPNKITELLITAYPVANYALVAELSADNIIDNATSPTLAAIAYDRMDTEIFEWTNITSNTDDDSPYLLWSAYYQSIASANHALEAIEQLKREGSTDNLDPQKGEALLIRAYSHFMLVNIFAKTYKDPTKSAADLGIPYITKSIETVTVKYDRNSVAEVYNLIAKDIEAGIPLIDDGIYAIPKYHFNRKAAHAFASQFYLYKRNYAKVIEHANAVLGTGNPTSLLRDWSTIPINSETQHAAYINALAPANLLVIPTYSQYLRRFQNRRYGWNGTAFNGITGAGPVWTRPSWLLSWIWTWDQNYGYFPAKIEESFEYTDKVAGIGYAHIVRTEFTTDDVLLNRAEAKILQGKTTDAVADLQYWNASHKGQRELTQDAITGFYKAGNTDYVFQFHTTELSPSFVVTSTQKPFIDCVLHFRRLERLLEGHRWFDLKRYGIEITHITGKARREITLTYDNDRRAIQIPQDVIGAGLTPNPQKGITNEEKKEIKQAF
ncbi:MAG: RagB/SusD family nutrient uptake outer membrane protein [Dysgonamonadaceae bacterium]|nr:RagB/SusD family nutrient uptake outer membrane protein [Dysgonamonadaceae bacterium]